MNAEVEQYQPPAPVARLYTQELGPPLPAAADVDGWIRVVADVAMLAERIADTDFVPDAMRRKPAAVAAAILAGREMGVGPMTALAHINVIKGKPGQDALLMRALVLAAGHSIEYGDCNDSRALVRGKRVGEDTWTEVTFTSDQARKAGIQLGGYPEDKLVARATSRLCRRKFADVISGLSYTLEELADGDADFAEHGGSIVSAPVAQPERPAGRTAQRRTKRPRAPETTVSQGAPPAAAGLPPLPGEDGYDDTDARGEATATAALSGGPREEAEAAPAPTKAQGAGEGTTSGDGASQPRADGDGPASNKQRNMLFAIFRQTDFDDRGDRLRISSRVLGRPIYSWAELTSDDASVLIDMFEALQRKGELVQRLTDLLAPDEDVPPHPPADEGA